MRRALAVSFCLLGLLIAAAWRTLAYKAVVVKGPTVGTRLAGIRPSGEPRRAGLRLHVFNTAMLRMSPLLVGAAAARWRPAPAFVLEHPDRGLVVFDCGVGPEVARRRQAALPPVLRMLVEVRAQPDRLLDAQMRVAGLDPARVTTVVLSHAHFDHAGQVGAFPQATVFGGPGLRRNHRGEWTASVPAPYDGVPQGRWQEVSLQGTPTYATFDGGRDLFGDRSLLLLPGGGHTREDLLALVPLPRGPALLTGDAVEDREWLDSDDVTRVPDLPERAAAVRNQVRALLRADPTLILVPGHDLAHLPADRSDVVLHRREWFSLDAWPEP